MNIVQMTFGHVPGVPAAGHMDGQFWHPGPQRNCCKGNCLRERERKGS